MFECQGNSGVTDYGKMSPTVPCCVIVLRLQGKLCCSVLLRCQGWLRFCAGMSDHGMFLCWDVGACCGFVLGCHGKLCCSIGMLGYRV